MRLDGPNGSHITWVILDPAKAGVWQSAGTRMIERLLPHIRHFVHVRQTLANANALGVPLSELLDSTGIGAILRRGRGLSERDGFLSAWLPADNARLQQLLAGAMPPFGG